MLRYTFINTYFSSSRNWYYVRQLAGISLYSKIEQLFHRVRIRLHIAHTIKEKEIRDWGLYILVCCGLTIFLVGRYSVPSPLPGYRSPLRRRGPHQALYYLIVC